MPQRLLSAAVVAALCLSAPLKADESLASLIPNLFRSTIVLDNTFHAAHFQSDFTGPGLINRAIQQQLGTFPLGSSGGGFTYNYDSNLGVFNRSTESFGPLYAERSQTLGKGRWNAGVSYQRAQYDAVDDIDLGNGELRFVLPHLDVSGNNFFEGDVILATTRITVDTDTTLFFATYGATDQLDLAVAVPVLRVDLEARSDLSINRLATAGSVFPIHRFTNGTTRDTLRAKGTASGVGDLLARAKYRFTADSPFAVALDLRLPTGNEEDLLGTGATQTKLYVVGSTAFGKFSPHANLGYTLSSGGTNELPNELNYAAGFDVALHPRLTFAADVVGRLLRDATSVGVKPRLLTFNTQADPTLRTTTELDLQGRRSDQNLLLGAVGVKFNPAGNLLISVNALLSLGTDGLQDKDIVPLIGVDYSF